MKGIVVILDINNYIYYYVVETLCFILIVR